MRGTVKLIQDSYEKSYHENFLYRETEQSQRNQARLRLVLQQKSGGSLLEIGCGKGGFLRLAETYFSVEGMDISHYAIQAAEEHFHQRVSVGDIEQRTLPHKNYDVIAVFNILEHLHQPKTAVQRLYRSLNDGGLLVGSVPNNFGLVGRSVTLLENFFDRTHVSTYPPAVWQSLFQEAGFRVVEFFGETTFGRNHSIYLHKKPAWPYMSFNLMFLCSK
jgi:2-polyprenyl-3-methyl-5-hydroxy-6-metoxy-1,4-benzoquinol methylase